MKNIQIVFVTIVNEHTEIDMKSKERMMAFIQLTKLKDKSPILFNVEYIESIEPEHINWKHSTTRIHYRKSFYDVSESFVQVAKLIERVAMVGIINLEGEVNVRGRTSDDN